MIKKVICIIAAISLLGTFGCEMLSTTETSTTTPASVRTIREANIGKTLVMKQLEIDLKTEVQIILRLKDGDKVEGYFYLLKGDYLGVTISGISPIYTFKTIASESPPINSDKYSFTANQGQGVAYTLTLNAGAGADEKQGETTVFLEIIYPVTGSLFVPIGTK